MWLVLHCSTNVIDMTRGNAGWRFLSCLLQSLFEEIEASIPFLDTANRRIR